VDTRCMLGVVVMGKVKQETIPDVDMWSEMLNDNLEYYIGGSETVTLKTYDQGQDCEQYEYTIKVDAWDDGDFWRVISAVEDIWADDGEDKKRNMLVTLLNKDHAIALRDMLNKVLG